MICEICRGVINNMRYIELVGGWSPRGAHKDCMRERIKKAFTDCIGTEDDDVGELVYDAIENHMEEMTPLSQA
jgi:hypothetical protein